MVEPKIGVWLCDCRGRISDSVDMSRLEQECRNQADVVFVNRVQALCAENAAVRMAEELKSSGADRALFVGCSARTSLRFPEHMLKSALDLAGIDQAMFEVANIREQCAWVHEPGPEVTAKAVDVMNMGLARLRLDQPPGPPARIKGDSLVIGGGAAGLAAAKSLAEMGRDVTVVEKGTYLGGRLCQIPLLFQNEKWPGVCVSACVGPVQAEGAVTNPNINVYLQAEVEQVAKKDGNFTATIAAAPAYVDPGKCTSCGRCAEVCPEEAAGDFEEGLFVRKAIDKDFALAVPDAYNILDQYCTKCGKCVEVCPAGAIDLNARPQTVQKNFGAVFLATGFDQYRLQDTPGGKYSSPDIVTGLQFERLLDHGVTRPSDGEVPEHIVFMLCAGSRATGDKAGEGVPYCSKTCCGITMKQAQKVALSMPETEVTIVYYYDIRAYERAFEAMYDQVKRMGVEFVRANVESIADNGGALSLSLAQLEGMEASAGGMYEFTDGKLSLDADMVVLASAQTPKTGTARIAEQLGVTTDPYGFPMETQPRIFRPTESFVDRVYVVGASGGPKVVQQAVEQGKAAAMTALPVLSRGEKPVPKFFSRIDPERCVNCRICETVCPHGAISLTENGMVADPAFCQSCGFCAAACPTHAAALVNFTDRQILNQVDAAFAGLKNGEPKIMALFCYWCAYGGADMAGLSGIKFPTNFRTIRIRCSSSVNTSLVMEMFKRGVDGVLVGGCPPGSCHHIWGNYLADKRMTLFSKMMEQLGLNPARLRFDYLGVSHAPQIADALNKMDRELRELGPNPAARGCMETFAGGAK